MNLPDLFAAPFTDPFVIALIVFTFLLAGLIKGMVGLGLPIVVLALLTTTLGLKSAMALFIVPGVAMNLWQALAGPNFIMLWRRLWLFWLAAIVGIWFGATWLASIEQATATLAFGILLTLYAGSRLSALKISVPASRERWLNPAVGGLAGFLFGATGQFMVPGVLYIEALGLKKDVFVKALGITFLVITTTLGVSMSANALMSNQLALISAAAVVPSFFGLWLGTKLRNRFSENAFRTLLFIWLLATGVFVIVRTVF